MLHARLLTLFAFVGLSHFAGVLKADPPAAAAAKKPNTATKAAPRPDAWWFYKHNSINDWAKREPVELMFLGDSITQGWGKALLPSDQDPKSPHAAKYLEEFRGNASWQKHFTPRKPLDAGIGGDRTQHVLWRLDHGLLDSIKPKVVVLMIGTNNSNGKDNTAEEIGEGIVAIVNKLKEKLPESKILLLAIFPRATDDPAVSSKLPKAKRAKAGKLGAQNAKLVAANAVAKSVADDKTVYYLDIGPKFLDKDGNLPDDIMDDFLHLTPKGYQIWAEAIDDKVAELLGEKK